VTLFALLLDQLIGELSKFHPLVGFGKFADFLQNKFNRGEQKFKLFNGILAWSLLVLPIFCLLMIINLTVIQQLFFDTILVYFCIGRKSMRQHSMKIYEPLNKNNLPEARHQCGMIVSRKVDNLSETEIARATVESVLENTNDAVVASLFWYLVGGAPFVILHRLVNTLDAMWGYKNEKYNQFGYFAAKADDLMAWPTAKFTAVLFAIQASNKTTFYKALSNANKQSKNYKSLNGGWVMAAGATVLGIQLNGNNHYGNIKQTITLLGEGLDVCKQDILRAVNLMDYSISIWMGLLLLLVTLQIL
ncbi:MAG: adenosylcobinamide-phosphate synthase CbiB, partial [Kangiellaceae bacterium]